MSSNRQMHWLVLILSVISLMGLCLVGIGLTAALAAWQQQRLDKRVTLVPDVEYGTGGGTRLVFDLARPREGAGPFPAVVCIHGGGWRGGDKSAYRGLIQNLASRGYVAVSVRYRFAPAHAFPAQIEDVKAAVRCLRARAAEYRIDTERIGAVGASAGGHLALLLAVTEETDGLEGEGGHSGHSSRIVAAASIFGPTDLTRPFPVAVEAMLKDLAGGTRDARPEAFQRASPVTYLSEDDPPLLLIHGTRDSLVPYSQATEFQAACQESKVSVELITIEKGDHGSGGNVKDWQSANVRMIEFLDRYLKPAKPAR